MRLIQHTTTAHPQRTPVSASEGFTHASASFFFDTSFLLIYYWRRRRRRSQQQQASWLPPNPSPIPHTDSSSFFNPLPEESHKTSLVPAADRRRHSEKASDSSNNPNAKHYYGKLPTRIEKKRRLTPKEEKLETCSEMCCPEVPPPEMRTLRSRGSARKGERRRGTHADDGFGMSGRAKPSNFPSRTATRRREKVREAKREGVPFSDRSIDQWASERRKLLIWRTGARLFPACSCERTFVDFLGFLHLRVWELFLIDFWRERAHPWGRFLLSTASVSTTHSSVLLFLENRLSSPVPCGGKEGPSPSSSEEQDQEQEGGPGRILQWDVTQAATKGASRRVSLRHTRQRWSLAPSFSSFPMLFVCSFLVFCNRGSLYSLSLSLCVFFQVSQTIATGEPESKDLAAIDRWLVLSLFHSCNWLQP
jgi:hypothetical protein